MTSESSGNMSKESLLESLRTMRVPFDVKDHAYLIEDALLDIPALSFYATCWWTDREAWDRRDVLIVLYGESLARYTVDTRGYEVVDVGGGVQLRYESRSVEIEFVPISGVLEVRMMKTEGRRGRFEEPADEPHLRILLDHEAFGGGLEFPIEEELEGRDRDDREAIFDRVRSFAAAVAERLAQS